MGNVSFESTGGKKGVIGVKITCINLMLLTHTFIQRDLQTEEDVIKGCVRDDDDDCIIIIEDKAASIRS